MDLHLPGMATACFVTGEAFAEDERIVSRLVRRHEDGEIIRIDIQLGAEDQLEVPGRVACRWVQAFKPKVAEENPEKEMKLTAENLFLTLAAPDNELSADDARLVQFLALMLERKRLVRPQGKNEDGTKDVYVHRGSKTRCEVPVGELTPAFFIAVQEQLSVIVGMPEVEDEAAPKTDQPAEPPQPATG
ncbi:MAG: hypothetical protein SynsKO_37750 [Synoicihabitans sp.]